MNIQQRWQRCVDDALYREWLEDDVELHDLAQRIFGDILETEDLPDWLARSLPSKLAAGDPSTTLRSQFTQNSRP